MPEEEENKTVFIYGIINPLNNDIVYVGRTITNLTKRYSCHRNKALRSPKSKFHLWLKDQLTANIIPKIITLEKCSISEMVDKESFWINKEQPVYNSAKPHKGGKRKNSIDWQPYIHLLGKYHDSKVAGIVGVTRKAVAYKRDCLNIGKCNLPQRIVIKNKIGGWNRKEITKDCENMLGTLPDYKLAKMFGFGKKKISNERKKRCILSYAEQTGNDGRIKQNEPHRRWSKTGDIAAYAS